MCIETDVDGASEKVFRPIKDLDGQKGHYWGLEKGVWGLKKVLWGTKKVFGLKKALRGPEKGA